MDRAAAGVKLARLVKLGSVPVQFAGAYEYNFDDDEWRPSGRSA